MAENAASNLPIRVLRNFPRPLAGRKRRPYLAAGRCRGTPVSPPRQAKNRSWFKSLRRMPMKFRPLHDRVVVKRIDAEEKSAGGIIIPDTAKEKPQTGEVIAIGPGGRDETGKLIPIDVKVGDKVLFGKWSGTEVKLDG